MNQQILQNCESLQNCREVWLGWMHFVYFQDLCSVSSNYFWRLFDVFKLLLIFPNFYSYFCVLFFVFQVWGGHPENNDRILYTEYWPEKGHSIKSHILNKYKNVFLLLKSTTKITKVSVIFFHIFYCYIF